LQAFLKGNKKAPFYPHAKIGVFEFLTYFKEHTYKVVVDLDGLIPFWFFDHAKILLKEHLMICIFDTLSSQPLISRMKRAYYSRERIFFLTKGFIITTPEPVS
jgi:hypothetical protein